MSLVLSIGRGPLADADLAGIARTYGGVDPRYGAPAFCAEVFNRNPFGWSWHAFARDGAEVVGHYAVIPMRARAGAVRFTSGKGEALYLDERHRAAEVDTPAGPMPAGVALMKGLHDFALADGAAVLHNITSAEIGMLQRMDGFRVAKEVRAQSHVLLSPDELRRLRGRTSQVLLARGLMAVQRAARVAAHARLALRGGAGVVVPGAHDDAPYLEAFSRTDPAPGGWSIARDMDTLRWLRRLERLDIVAVAGSPGLFAIVNGGRAREILHWSVPASDPRGGLAVLATLVERAARDRAWIVSLPQALVADPAWSLGSAARVLCFRDRPVDQQVYVKAASSDVPGAAPLVFNRMFNV